MPDGRLCPVRGCLQDWQASSIRVVSVGERCLVRGNHQEMQPPVLVGVRQRNEFGQRVKPAPLQSLVRLKGFEDLDVAWADVREIAMTSWNELPGMRDDGELDVRRFLLGGPATKV
ncbi:MAG TPA: hypothetical protein VF043_39090 [Ktedonobacteraceae bacterium]